MTGPIASIIVSLVLTVGILFGTGSFESKSYTYATANFDGGFQKIGVISREEIYTEARLEMNGEELVNGDFEKVIDWIETASRDSGGVDRVTWKDGVRLKATVGIKWVGSESNFTLPTDFMDIESTNETPLKPSQVIAQMKAMEQNAKAARVDNARRSLTFGPAPTESFLISKILAAFD